MKILLLIFCSFLFCNTALAQTTYNNSYDIAGSSDRSLRVFKKDSLIFTISICLSPQSNALCTGILCANLEGEEQWTMVIDSFFMKGSNVVTMTEDYIYLALFSRSEVNNGPSIFKVDFAGNLLESANIIDEDNFTVYGLYKTEDGFKIYATKTSAGDSIEVYGALIYLNEEYEQISLKRYTTMDVFQYITYAIVELGEAGSALISGYGGTDFMTRTTIFRLDNDGNVLWTYPLQGENRLVSTGLDLLYLPNDGFYVTFYAVRNAQGPLYPGSNQTKLAKFSKDGELIWIRVLNLIEDTFIKKIILTSDQEFVGIGLTNGLDSIVGGQGYITKFDLESNIQWERIFVEPFFSEDYNFNTFQDGLELDNGDLVLCGKIFKESYSSGTPEFRNRSWLVRTTADGCLDIDDCEDYSLSESEEIALADRIRFKIYPNPVGSQLNVSVANLETASAWNIRIFNLNGQIVKTEKIYDFPYSTTTEDLVRGFYYLELTNTLGVRRLLKFAQR